jgi:hypothetical protein
MSAVKETYGYNNDRCRLTYKYSITGILTNQEELLEKQNILLEAIEAIMNKAFDSAEEEIEKELYKKGLMTCSANLESIDDMRVNGNYLVQDHIKELDEKYSGKEIAYVIVCQPTELPEAYYFTGFSEIGEAQFGSNLAEAYRYHSLSKAKQMAEFLMRSRAIVNYTVRLDTLK